MDPDTALAAILDDARRVVEADKVTGTEDAGHVELAEYVLGLHGWLAAGGFLPSVWHLATCMSGACRQEEVVGQMGGE